MKGLTFVYYYHMLHLIENDIVRSALSGIERYFTSKNAPCYTIISSDSFHEKCDNLCCDYSVFVLDDLLEEHFIHPLRVNVLVNSNDYDSRLMKLISRSNTLLFQKVKNSRLFAIYEHKLGKGKLTHFWDGTNFIDAMTLKAQRAITRRLKNEVLNIGSAFTPPFSVLKTLKNGHLIIGGGVANTFLRAISQRDKFNLKWTDVLNKEKLIWGTLYKNGSATGLVKYILEAKIDVAPVILCGLRLHRNLVCTR